MLRSLDLQLSGISMFSLAIHPGEYLRSEWIEQARIDAATLAAELGLSSEQVSALLSGRIAVEDALAQKIGRVTETAPGLWLDMQYAYNLSRRSLSRPKPELGPGEGATG